jgi:hypothetical protein
MKFESLEPNGSFFMQVGNVLSLFNGISALHLALDKAGIKHGQVYYAELRKISKQIHGIAEQLNAQSKKTR